ncbi:uncharacterized protein PHACADRAFT_250728 [Phanerochaete carnosa HHB-10118-sp]|uniref:Uncharacterized protein n=1 Tax=Phanerochaete carnosa (strain HHB-10118-sp) TaxID=650164 RepID=K5W7K7_PHACS|nr:uncharacterized protein PHACADRAFT_250728 [Phanerochaete carnosa HHB-10118-sp]EKM59923.1 hypothetical protein PHACADRAFT_250728 [Phanerochaete carnosa HHB-10118-sp]
MEDPFLLPLPLPTVSDSSSSQDDASSVVDISAATGGQRMPQGHVENAPRPSSPPPPSAAANASSDESVDSGHASEELQYAPARGVRQAGVGSAGEPGRGASGVGAAAAAPVIVMLSSLALYMLLFSPIA